MRSDPMMGATTMAQKSTILLVHGAWANASAWEKVLPLLHDAGTTTIAIALPLTSLVEDTATLGRAIALTDGPVLLVGHSYGGAVITQGGNDPKVTGLVYVNGFGPDTGESAGSLGAAGPPTSLPDNLQPDAQGFLKLTRKGVKESFAQDLTSAEQALIFATQGPVSGPFALGAEIDAPAWKVKPCWYLRGTNDHAIHPELQAMMAKRMEATTVDTDSSHVPMLSQPQKVVDLILRAVG
jgi:pimeloyl-ACP methyl ester carboxylesterase